MAQKKDIIDVLVVGAGASGAAFVWSLAEAGIDVMCLEQGGGCCMERQPLEILPSPQPLHLSSRMSRPSSLLTSNTELRRNIPQGDFGCTPGR